MINDETDEVIRENKKTALLELNTKLLDLKKTRSSRKESMQLTLQNVSSLYPRLTHQQSGLSSQGVRVQTHRKSVSFDQHRYLDGPGAADPHGPAIIYGVESEEIEEINDAYNDLVEDLGLSKLTENELEEVMPSCGPLLLVEYIIFKIENLWSKPSGKQASIE